MLYVWIFVLISLVCIFAVLFFLERKARRDWEYEARTGDSVCREIKRDMQAECSLRVFVAMNAIRGIHMRPEHFRDFDEQLLVRCNIRNQLSVTVREPRLLNPSLLQYVQGDLSEYPENARLYLPTLDQYVNILLA